jgi:hypothetical protein
MTKTKNKDFEDLNIYEQILHLFSEMKAIDYQYSQLFAAGGYSKDMEELHIQLDAECDVYKAQIKDSLKHLYLYSAEKNYYYFDCPFKVYENYFDSRKNDFLKNNPDAEYIDFLKAEINYFKYPFFNRIIDEYRYHDYIDYEDKYRISLNKKIDFLRDEIAPFGYTISTFESRNLKDAKGTIIGFGTEIILNEPNTIASEFQSQKISSHNNLTHSNIKLKWTGKKAHLGFIMGTLVDLGYIQAPEKPNGEINHSALARIILNLFDCDSTPGSLSKYLNVTCEKSEEVRRNFTKNGFNIPHSKTVG